MLRPPHADCDITAWQFDVLAAKFSDWYGLDPVQAADLAAVAVKAVTRHRMRAERLARRKKMRREAYSAWASKAKRRALWGRDEGCCAMCGKPVEFEEMTVGHIVPVSWGGSSGWENVQVECYRCNKNKGSRFIPRREGAAPLLPEPGPERLAAARLPQKHVQWPAPPGEPAAP